TWQRRGGLPSGNRAIAAGKRPGGTRRIAALRPFAAKHAGNSVFARQGCLARGRLSSSREILDAVARGRKGHGPGGADAFCSRRLISESGRRGESQTGDAGIPEITGKNPGNTESTEVEEPLEEQLLRDLAGQLTLAGYRLSVCGRSW